MKLPVSRTRRPWNVYILRCRDGSLYTGTTNDLVRRLEQHAAGKGSRYTRSRLPVRLVYEEHAKNRGAALRREAALKRLTRAAKLALVTRWLPGRVLLLSPHALIVRT
jgi:putative endonuclease